MAPWTWQSFLQEQRCIGGVGEGHEVEPPGVTILSGLWVVTKRTLSKFHDEVVKEKVWM